MSAPSEPQRPTLPPRRIDPSTFLEKGTLVGDKFEISEQLGSSELATSYLATRTDEPDAPKVALKILDRNLMALFLEFEDTLEAAVRCDQRSLSRIHGWGSHNGQPFVALEYVKGQTLKHAIERKQAAKSKFMPRTALSLISPVAHALTAIHERDLPHGALTPRNVYVERSGRVRLANLGFGWLMLHALGDQGLGAGFDSPFIAPEARDDPGEATKSSDIYSLGLITICLLAGRIPSVDAATGVARELLNHIPPALHDLLSASIAIDPSLRPPSAAEFLSDLSVGIEQLRDQLIQTSRGIELPPEQEPELPASESLALAAMLSTDELPAVPDEGDDPVWVIHRAGMDFGPYSSEQVREQFLEDAIDERTEIYNLVTEERCGVEDTDEFAEFVQEYIPIRNERRRREEERREEIQRKVKRASGIGVVTAMVGVLAVVAFYIYYLNFIRPQPQEINLDLIMARVSSTFEVPSQAYVGIGADPELMASLFNFDVEDEEAEPERRRSRRRDRSDRTAREAQRSDGIMEATLTFGDGGPTRRLTQRDINNTIQRDASALRRCLRNESAISRNFHRGGIEMRFHVRGDGRPVGVTLDAPSASGEMHSCMERVFRGMRFPEHNDFPVPVSFPFEVQ